jgi:signal peptidase I
VGALIELVVIVVAAIALALVIQAYAIKPYQIPSGSMEPTLTFHPPQRVLVNRFLYHIEDPEIGDIVVFHPPAGADPGGPDCGVEHDPAQPCPEPTPEISDETFIKRIVAGPGDRLRVEKGVPIVNGQPIEQDYETRPCPEAEMECNLTEEITIPPDHYFMMGDNRGMSDDSRFWGPVPRDWIIGQAFATYWPPDRVGIF